MGGNEIGGLLKELNNQIKQSNLHLCIFMECTRVHTDDHSLSMMDLIDWLSTN